MEHLGRGKAVLHFAAGRIEPDLAFDAYGVEPLARWQTGTGRLARAAADAGGSVVAALVLGVHSRRAKELSITKLAERRGLSTLAPLLQVAIPALREVAVTVRFTPRMDAWEAGLRDARLAAAVRERALGLVRAELLPGPTARAAEGGGEAEGRVAPSRQG
jgi:hypothetical protein